MSTEVWRYALAHIILPAGPYLWLQGPVLQGDGLATLYTPDAVTAAELRSSGMKLVPDIAALTAAYSSVLINAPKSRAETEGLIALALTLATDLVIAVAANDAGGKRLVDMFAAYGVPTERLVKHKHQIVWTRAPALADPAMLADQCALLAPRLLQLGGRGWWTQPGLFGWDKIDPGSELLAAQLPPDLAGEVADFGCGYGYLTAHLSAAYPGITQVTAYDSDARAVACCVRNAPARVTASWQDVRRLVAGPHFDAIVMNPPFHSGKAALLALGQEFLTAAWGQLKPGGQLWLVANRHLPYEHILPALKIAHENAAYKIMRAVKPARSSR